MARQKKTEQIKISPFEQDEKGVTFELPKYSDKETKYRDFLLRLMTQDRNNREQPHDEFNGMSYTERYKANMRGAYSYSPPRKNPEDTSVVTGTTREKSLSVISSIINLDFQTKFKAFDKDDEEYVELGEAMSDVVFRTNQLDEWDRKKLAVYWELVTQGDVFVECVDQPIVVTDKKRIGLNEVTEETFKLDFTKGLRTAFSGSRFNLLAGTQVYLGNLREREIDKQPRIFTREIMPYQRAKTIYGHLPRWKNVPDRLVEFNGQINSDEYGVNWRLEDVENDMVEVIKFQDAINDEYQIFINGVMQLPVGFPLPWEFGGYNIIQGSLEPISSFFAYSKSYPDKTKLDQEILDEMYRLIIMKWHKSVSPPIANYSGQLLDRSSFNAGKVTNNLQRGDIEVLGGNPSQYALQSSEFQAFDRIKQIVDEKTVSPILQGINPGVEQTATLTQTVTQQAKQRLGVMIFGFLNLHLKLDTLRLYTELDSCTRPQGTKVKDLKDGLESKYKSFLVERDMGNGKSGLKRIEFTENLKSSRDLYAEGNGLVFDEAGNVIEDKQIDRPKKIIQINPVVLRSIPLHWYGEVEIGEKETSAQERVLFTDQLATAYKLFGMQSINSEYAMAQWAKKNKINGKDLFVKNAGMMAPMQEEINKIEESPMSKRIRTTAPGFDQAVKQGYG